MYLVVAIEVPFVLVQRTVLHIICIGFVVVSEVEMFASFSKIVRSDAVTLLFFKNECVILGH